MGKINEMGKPIFVNGWALDAWPVFWFCFGLAGHPTKHDKS
ncbi:hypothetical protein [Methylomonas paludis]|nr:hypothetical protein [Methylomonas paludis]